MGGSPVGSLLAAGPLRLPFCTAGRRAQSMFQTASDQGKTRFRPKHRVPWPTAPGCKLVLGSCFP